MIRKKIIFLYFYLIFFGLFLLLLSCGGDPETDNNLHRFENIVVPIENDIQTLDPSQLSDPYTSRIVWQIYQGLVGLSNEGKPIPVLAESWKSSNNFRKWTFRIRPNVYFHENEAFREERKTRSITSNDVLYSYTRFAKGFGSFIFSNLVVGLDDYLSGATNSISGFRATDKHTFEINLTRPDPSFIYRITSPYLCIMPREVIEAFPVEFGRTIAVGTGPFKIHNHTASQIVLERDKNYWDNTSSDLKKVTFKVEKNQQIRVAQFEKGVFDLMDIPIPIKSKFLNDKTLLPRWESDYYIYQKMTFNVHYLGFDLKMVADTHLRRAISMAINKHPIVENLLGGFAVPASELVPPGLQGFNAPMAIGYDPSQARIELGKSQYKGRTLELLVSDTPNHEPIAQLIQSQLDEIGIKVKLNRVDLNTLISRLFSENRPEMFIAFSEWVYSAPELILESYISNKYPNPNLTGYNNPEVDKLMGQALATDDRTTINDVCEKVSYLVGNDAPLIPLYHLTKTIIIRKKYKNFSINGHQYWNFSEIKMR